LVICLVGLILLILRRKQIQIKEVFAPLALIAYCTLNIILIGVTRGYLERWYASVFMFFWIGMVGLVYVFFSSETNASGGRQFLKSFRAYGSFIWGITVVGVIGYFYATSNLTYEDKSFFLRRRSPVSASCLRHYEFAPTYCEPMLFSSIGESKFIQQLAVPLERNRLSVFSPTQRWSLQGDFILPSVSVHENPSATDIFWSADLSAQKVPFQNYRHLNLVLGSSGAVDWTVSLPLNLKKATFRSAIAMSDSITNGSISKTALFEIDIESEGKKQTLFRRLLEGDQHSWVPIEISLDRFAGKTIKLNLSSSSESLEGNWGIFRYPFIDVTMDTNEDGQSTDKKKFQPSNTTFSSLLPGLSNMDFHFDLTNSDLWSVANMEAVPSRTECSEQDASAADYSNYSDPITRWVVGNDPNMQYLGSLNLCLAEYSQFFVRLSASPEIKPRMLQIFYRLDDQEAFDEDHSIEIPLLRDGNLHSYTYDLKLLELNNSSRLTGIRLDPVMTGNEKGPNRIQISDFYLISRDPHKPGFCS
jgi:hypothetical protein